MGKKFKMLKRCAISNKVINGKEVVLTDYALDYVKQMGYIVVEKRTIQNKAFAVVLLMLMVAFVQIIPSISAIHLDFLEGHGSFDTAIDYNKWIKINSGGTSILETNITFNGTSGSLRERIVGSNMVMLNKATHSFDFNGNTTYQVQLVCDAKSGAGATSATSCYFDEVTLNSNNNTLLNFSWRKSYTNAIPLYNIAKINLIYPNNETFTIWENDSLIFNNWYSNSLNLNSIIEIPPEEIPRNPTVFTIDLTATISIIALVIIGIVILISFLYGLYVFSGALLSLIGLIFLFNDVNLLLSALIICLGVVTAFKT